MKTLLSTLSLLIFMAFPVSGYSELIYVQNAIEAASVNVKIDASLKGSISVSECAKCKNVQFKITPDTRAEHKGKKVHLSRIRSLKDKPATVIYDTKTKTAVNIIW